MAIINSINPHSLQQPDEVLIHIGAYFDSNWSKVRRADNDAWFVSKEELLSNGWIEVHFKDEGVIIWLGPIEARFIKRGNFDYTTVVSPAFPGLENEQGFYRRMCEKIGKIIQNP
jgi:hypothetical protein